MIEQQVPCNLGPVTRIEHQHAAQTGDRRGGRGDARMVRLRRALAHQHRRVGRQGVGQEVLELAHLVAAEGETGQIVALEVDAG